MLDGCTDATRERARAGGRRPAPARHRAPAAGRGRRAPAGHGRRLRAAAGRRRARRPGGDHRRRLRGRARLAGRAARGRRRRAPGRSAARSCVDGPRRRRRPAPRRPRWPRALRALPGRRAPALQRRLDRGHRRHLPPRRRPGAARRARGRGLRPRAGAALGFPSRGSPARACAPRRARPAAPSAGSRATSRSTRGWIATPTAAAISSPPSWRRARPRPSRSSCPRARWRRRSAATVDVLRRFVEAGAVDELLVVDAASADGTAAVARAAGADGGAGGRPHARLRAVPRQGRRHVARAGGDDRRRSWPTSTATARTSASACSPGCSAPLFARRRAGAGQGRLPAALRGRRRASGPARAGA